MFAFEFAITDKIKLKLMDTLDSNVFFFFPKVVEIAPAFQLDPHLRDRLHADAVSLAKQVSSNLGCAVALSPSVLASANVCAVGGNDGCCVDGKYCGVCVWRALLRLSPAIAF